MKSFIAASAFAALVAAAPAPIPQAGSTTPLRFGGTALATTTPIHTHSINANANAFYIGKNTTTSCPSEDAATCETCKTVNTNQTIFSYFNGAQKLSLDTLVTGGQQVYVTEGDAATGQLAGQLKFTSAGSTATSGPALYTGFSTVYDAQFQFEGKDWFACAVDDFNSGYSIWSQARVAGSNAGEGCIAFTWKVVQVGDETKQAWQYV